jgi:hypothetical protein
MINIQAALKALFVDMEDKADSGNRIWRPVQALLLNQTDKKKTDLHEIQLKGYRVS